MRSSPQQPRRSNKSGRTVSIIGTGSYLPERILTNRDLEKIVETSDRMDQEPYRNRRAENCRAGGGNQ